MRNLGKTWLVKVRYWYQQNEYSGGWRDSGLRTDNFIIEEDDFMSAGKTIINHLYKDFSDVTIYKNVHIEVYDISEYDVPSNFLVKEY